MKDKLTVTVFVLVGSIATAETMRFFQRYDDAYNAGRHDVVKAWYTKCRGAYTTEPPGTKLLATYCGTEMEDLIGVKNIWPGEFP